LGPGARRQEADDPRARLRAAAIGRGGFDDAGEIPARPPARLGHLQRPSCLAAVQRDRGNPHTELVAVRIAQLDRLDREFLGCRRIDDDGADGLWHRRSFSSDNQSDGRIALNAIARSGDSIGPSPKRAAMAMAAASVISSSRPGACASIAARISPPWHMLIAASRAEPEWIG